MDPVPPVLVPRRVISVQLITPTVNLFNNLLDQKHDLKKIYDLEEKMLAVLHFFKNLPQPDCFKLFISWNFSFFWGGDNQYGTIILRQKSRFSDSSSTLLRIIVSYDKTF